MNNYIIEQETYIIILFVFLLLTYLFFHLVFFTLLINNLSRVSSSSISFNLSRGVLSISVFFLKNHIIYYYLDCFFNSLISFSNFSTLSITSSKALCNNIGTFVYSIPKYSRLL